MLPGQGYGLTDIRRFETAAAAADRAVLSEAWELTREEETPDYTLPDLAKVIFGVSRSSILQMRGRTFSKVSSCVIVQACTFADLILV